MIEILRIAYKRELALAETVEQCDAIRVAYLGKNGIIRQIERALWKPTPQKKG
jgi:hypothetical protein